MGLVNELQESAEQDDVLTVLRKAKRVSAKLGRQDIMEWLRCEQQGYPDGVKLPTYRHVSVKFCYNTNGYIPAGFGFVKNGIVPIPELDTEDHTLPVREPVSIILSWLDAVADGNGIFQPIGGTAEEKLRNMFKTSNPALLRQISFLARLDETGVRHVSEQIKDVVLDWACDLEAAGVTGIEHSFSENEKETAQTVVFNISHSTIDQLNNSGKNFKST